MNDRKAVYVIACGVLGPEIKHLAKSMGLELKMKFLPGKLHNTPDFLRTSLQTAIDEASEDPFCGRIVVGYGLCGRGTVGVRATKVPLIFPKIHDCIALFLGSDRVYKEQFTKFPGTYYFTEGWYDEKEYRRKEQGKTVWVGDRAVGCAELENRYGKKKGAAVVDFFSSWTSNYQRAAYIDTGITKREKSILSAKEMADEHRWEFQRLAGDLSLLKKLLTSDCSDDEIVFVPIGHKTVYSAAGNCIGSAPENESRDERICATRQIICTGPDRDSGDKSKVRYGLGVDAGGTYTDGVIYDFLEKKIVVKSKSLTTKWDFSVGINNCLEKLNTGFLPKVEFVSVSTTLATNAIVEGEGQRVGLLLMGGILQNYNARIAHSPKAYIKGAMNIRGVESEAVDPEQVQQVVRQMIEQEGVSAFAVSGYGGSINPAHEQLVRDIIVEGTGLVVCCGHEFSSQLNLVTRAQTAIVNGKVIPRMIGFLKDLDQVLEEYGISVPVMVVKGDGTLISKKTAMQKPVETVFSGPAASVAGARHLTGVDNAMVVDIGGTTTDTADIVDGEVAVSSEGAVVGDVKTHVRALKMKTVGLGGDSHIRFCDGEFTLGPRRVAPLVWAHAEAKGGIDKALASIAVHSVQRQEQIILVALDGTFNFTPTAAEEKIYDLLHDRPKTSEQLARELDIISPRLLRLGRLEQSGLVQRCGLTPTDILHIKNFFNRWPAPPAHRMLEILALALKKEVDQLTEELLQLINYKLCRELLNNSLFDGFSQRELDGSPIYQHIVNGLLGSKEMRYGVQPVFKHTVVGIGAPAAYFLPKAAEMLSAQVIIPEDGDVANALGAVISHVLVRKNLVVRPDSEGMYVVEGVVDNPCFSTLDRAEKWAVSHLTETLRKNAKEAGTSEETVIFNIDDRIAPLKNGSSMFLERNISAHLKGNPDLGLQTEPLTS